MRDPGNAGCHAGVNPALTQDDIRAWLDYAAERERRLLTASWSSNQP